MLSHPFGVVWFVVRYPRALPWAEDSQAFGLLGGPTGVRHLKVGDRHHSLCNTPSPLVLRYNHLTAFAGVFAVAEERFKLPLVDVASIVVAPVLVMLMVGSLVFFLIEVLQGHYSDRLHYTFGFYVFGAVLVARIAITQNRWKSVAYGLVLGGACFIACMAFVEYEKGLWQMLGPIINVGLIALVWWCSDKLTWDCTHLDEARKASGRGVLAAAGIDGTKSTTAAEDDEEFDPDRSLQESRKKKKKKEPPPAPVVGWFQKFQKFREWRKKKPHTPGVWVLYFALAAIPLFALGQAMIPADDDKRRAATFWQMAVYVGSALGLLVTTTLMGLKRYLEDRKATIPTVLTAAWLGLGGLLIVAFIGVAAVLPRPHSETPLFAQQKGGKLDRKASKNAVIKDNSAGKGEGAAGQRKESGDGKSQAQGGKPGGEGKGQAQGQGNNQGGNQSGGNKGDKQGEKGGDGNKGNGDKSKDGNKEGNKGNDPKNNKDGNKGNGDKSGDDDQGKAEDKSDGEGDDGDGSDGEKSNPFEKLGQGFETASEVVKWIVWIVLAIAVIGGGGYMLLKYFSQFTGWAKGLLDWLRGLFGKKPAKTKAEKEEEAAEEEELQRPPPFSAFDNPFTDGTAKKRTARELAEYTFAAFDAWAWDRDLGRQPDETPSEFAARIAEDFPDLEEPGRQLAELYVMAMFSKKDLPADAKSKLAKFWESLENEPAVR